MRFEVPLAGRTGVVGSPCTGGLEQKYGWRLAQQVPGRLTQQSCWGRRKWLGLEAFLLAEAHGLTRKLLGPGHWPARSSPKGTGVPSKLLEGSWGPEAGGLPCRKVLGPEK